MDANFMNHGAWRCIAVCGIMLGLANQRVRVTKDRNIDVHGFDLTQYAQLHEIIAFKTGIQIFCERSTESK